MINKRRNFLKKSALLGGLPLVGFDKQVLNSEKIPCLAQDTEIIFLSEKLRRVSFFDLPKSAESIDTRSKFNRDEVNFTLALV